MFSVERRLLEYFTGTHSAIISELCKVQYLRWYHHDKIQEFSMDTVLLRIDVYFNFQELNVIIINYICYEALITFYSYLHQCFPI